MSTTRITAGQIPCYTTWTGYTSAISYRPLTTVTTSKTDTVRRRRPQGPFALYSQGTGVSYQIQRVNDAPISVSYLGSGSQGIVTMNYAVSQDYPLGKSTLDGLQYLSFTDRLRNKLLSQIKGDGVNLANMVGEYKETAELFVSATKKFVVLTNAVYARDPRYLNPDYYLPNGCRRRGLPRRVTRDISNHWLEYIYGVVPLMADIHDSLDALKKRFEDRPVIQKLRAQHREHFKTNFRALGSYSGRSPMVDVEIEAQRKDKAMGIAVMKNDLLLRSLGAYGFTNPAGVAWELTRFSFVVDWFVNVGEVINSLDNALYIDSGYFFVSSTYSYNETVRAAGSVGTYSLRTGSRTTPQALGSVASFAIKNPFSAVHVANALALVRQLYR